MFSKVSFDFSKKESLNKGGFLFFVPFFSDRTEEIFSPDKNFAATVQKFLSDRMKKYFSPYRNFLPTAGIFPPAFVQRKSLRKKVVKFLPESAST
jgi:hypothetical protein